MPRCHPDLKEDVVADDGPQIERIASKVARRLHKQLSGKRRAKIPRFGHKSLHDATDCAAVSNLVQSKLEAAGHTGVTVSFMLPDLRHWYSSGYDADLSDEPWQIKEILVVVSLLPFFVGVCVHWRYRCTQARFHADR